MTDDERARFLAFIDALAVRVASRPDILASPAGFFMGALVGAGRSDPADAWRPITGLADGLAYIGLPSRDGAVDPAAILRSLIPAG